MPRSILKKLDNTVLRAPFPRSIIWFLTERCHLRCPHCFVTTDSRRRREELPPDEAVSFVSTAGLRQVALTGGEPTLYPGLYDVLDACKQYGVDVGITTTGYRIGPLLDHLDKRRHKVCFQVSVDGTERSHNAIRRNDRAYADAIELISTAPVRGHPVVVVMTVCAANIADLEAVLELGASRRVPVFLNFIRSSDQTQGAAPSDFVPAQGNDLSLSEMRDCLTLWSRYAARYMSFKDMLAMTCKTEQVLRFNTDGDWDYPCAAGINDAVLYSNGDVAVCETLSPIGNIATAGGDWKRFWAGRHERLKRCFCQWDCAMIYSLPRSIWGAAHLARTAAGLCPSLLARLLPAR